MTSEKKIEEIEKRVKKYKSQAPFAVYEGSSIGDLSFLLSELRRTRHEARAEAFEEASSYTLPWAKDDSQYFGDLAAAERELASQVDAEACRGRR